MQCKYKILHNDILRMKTENEEKAQDMIYRQGCTRVFLADGYSLKLQTHQGMV